MPILWRFGLKSLLQIFVLALTSIIALLLVARSQEIIRFITIGGVISDALFVLALQVPYILPYAIPIAGLIAASLTTHNLSTTYELTALRTSGISIGQVLAPLKWGGAFLMLLTFAISAELTPFCRNETASLLAKAKTDHPLLLLRQHKYLKLDNLFVSMKHDRATDTAHDITLAHYNEKEEGLDLFLAKTLKNEKNLLVTQDAAYFTHLKKNGATLVENQKETESPAQFIAASLVRTSKITPVEYCSFKKLLDMAFFDTDLPFKAVAHARFEITRRIFFPLAAFVFTYLGLALGIDVSRQPRIRGSVISGTLATLSFGAFLASKSLYRDPLLSSLLAITPLLFLGAIAWYYKRKITRGKPCF